MHICRARDVSAHAREWMRIVLGSRNESSRFQIVALVVVVALSSSVVTSESAIVVVSSHHVRGRPRSARRGEH